MVKKKRQSDVHDGDSSTDSGDDTSKCSPTATTTCQHVKSSVDSNALRKKLKTSGLALECSQCNKKEPGVVLPDTVAHEEDGFEYDNTLWLCLRCGSQLCGRSRNQHALEHFKVKQQLAGCFLNTEFQFFLHFRLPAQTRMP